MNFVKIYLCFFLLSVPFLSYSQEANTLKIIQDLVDSSRLAAGNKTQVDRELLYTMQAEFYFNELKEKPVDLEKEILYNYQSIFYKLKHFDLYERYSKQLIQHLEENEIEEKLLARIYGNLSSYYLKEDRLDEAEGIILKILTIKEKEKDSLALSSIKNNYGILCLKKGNYSKAADLFASSLRLNPMEDLTDSVLQLSVKDNIADLHLLQNDTAKALVLLNERYLFYIKREKSLKRLMNYEKLMHTAKRLCNIYILQKKYNLASTIIDNLESLFTINYVSNYLPFSIDFKELRIKIRKETKQKGLLTSMEELDSLKDIQIAQLKAQELANNKLVSDYLIKFADQENARFKAAVNEEKSEAKTRLWMVSISFLFLIVFILLIYINNRRKLKIEEAEKTAKVNELKIERLEKEKLSQDLTNKGNDLSDLSMGITLKEDWHKNIITRLKEMKKGKQLVEASEIGTLIRELNQRTMMYEKIDLYQSGINQVNSAFFQRLDEKYPNLSKSERELCGFYRLRLESKEIATIKNIQPASVRKLRHRLRKKLELPLEENIYDFVAKI